MTATIKRLSDHPSVRVTAVGSPEDRFGASGELGRCPAVRYPTQTIGNKKQSLCRPLDIITWFRGSAAGIVYCSFYEHSPNCRVSVDYCALAPSLG